MHIIKYIHQILMMTFTLIKWPGDPISIMRSKNEKSNGYMNNMQSIYWFTNKNYSDNSWRHHSLVQVSCSGRNNIFVMQG